MMIVLVKLFKKAAISELQGERMGFFMQKNGFLKVLIVVTDKIVP